MHIMLNKPSRIIKILLLHLTRRSGFHFIATVVNISGRLDVIEHRYISTVSKDWFEYKHT